MNHKTLKEREKTVINEMKSKALRANQLRKIRELEAEEALEKEGGTIEIQRAFWAGY